MKESFCMCNVAAISKSVDGKFMKLIEELARDLTKDYEKVHIFTGTLHMEKDDNGNTIKPVMC